MDDKSRIGLSRFLSRALRHKPHEIGLELDAHGYASIDALIERVRAAGRRITEDELREVVTRCDKQRFSIDEATRRIRANQGHSIPVDLALTPTAPPPRLFHGTVARVLDAILADGLVRGQRHHVHLSADEATATRVGARRGRPVILAVDSGRMAADGHEFFRSANGVWLTTHVPPSYLQVLR